MRRLILSFALVALWWQQLCAESTPGFRLQPGFEITEFAGSSLANDIHCMTIDPKGRIIVSGPGYIRILVDEKNEGKATRAIDFATAKEGAQGLLWEGDSLLAVVDGGLWRYREMPDGRVAKPELLRKLKTGGEHDCHAIRRGPDGWLYLIGGNNSKFDKSYASLDTSPIKEPIAGCLVRFSPDYKDSEILADGFRNPYCFDISPDGDIFTFDSDNERCVSLPWYEPTRLYHVIPGRNHGWMSPQYGSFWRRPPYFFDVSPPLLTLGRGSPTSVVYYDRQEWPAANRGLYLLDWTFGRVYSVNLERRWTSFEAKSQVFLESTGSNGFAPTAAAIHPMTGDLYVSTGGRGTRGAVYRIHCIAASDSKVPSKKKERPKWRPEWSDDYARRLLEYTTTSYSYETSLQALIDLHRHRAKFTQSDLMRVIRDNWNASDRYIRLATADMISDLTPESQHQLTKEAAKTQEKLLVGFGICEGDSDRARQLALDVLKAGRDIDWTSQLDAVRLLEKSLGDMTDPRFVNHIWEGYTPRRTLPADRYPEVRALLRSLFGSHYVELERETSRALAILEDDDLSFRNQVMKKLDNHSDPVDDVHYLIVISRLRGERTIADTQLTVFPMLELGAKLEKGDRNRDHNWPLRIVELCTEFTKKDANFSAMLSRHINATEPEQIVFTRCPQIDRKPAAELLWLLWDEKCEKVCNDEMVALLAENKRINYLPILRKLWEHGGLQNAILPVLAREPEVEDHDKFLSGLVSPKISVVQVCLNALDKLTAKDDGPTLLAFIRGMRMLPDGKEADALRPLFAAALKKRTHQDLGPDKAKWTAWFERAYPDLAKKLGGPDGVDVAAWQKRLASVDWAKGEAQRGKAVFQKAGCINCHSGSQAMGPDLAGVGSRFSRDDLFTAIIQPSKDISPRYRTTQIETTDGKTHQGLIVYEAVDGVILQTGPAETVRIDGKKIESRRLTDTSLMPVGLIDKFSDTEIADLYAFLRAK